jgi:putative polyhydroxyalkanoate system protein
MRARARPALPYNAAMASIDLTHRHSLPPEAARRAVEEAIEKVGRKMGVDYRWEGDTLHFQRQGVDGRIALVPGEVHVAAKLGLLFSALKGTIESELLRVLQERLP